MKPAARLPLTLTLLNLVLLLYQIVPVAQAQDVPAVLRARGLEILDDQGRTRLQVKVEPASSPVDAAGGKPRYPETVIFRLITADGKPRVKLTTSDEGSGLMLLGSSDTTHTILKSDGSRATLLLRNDEATQRILTP